MVSSRKAPCEPVGGAFFRRACGGRKEWGDEIVFPQISEGVDLYDPRSGRDHVDRSRIVR